jgi:hypothetical protein
MSPANLDRLRSIKTLPQLVAYLRDVLDWPIESDDTADITFDYTAAELGLDEKAAVRIKEIKQLRPLASGQPWGIFFINFEKKRLPVVAMRRILRALALRKRESSNKAEAKAWQSADLLFISAYGEADDRALTFAHFVESPDSNLAELRVLGWDDDDTPLKLDYVVRTLGEKLRWQDEFADDPRKWRARWAEAFRIRHGHVILTSAELAGALAVLARRIRARVSKILEMEAGTGEIRTLQRAFQIGLIHDLDDAAFADMFAQTITYGLFSLACRRTHPGAGTAFVKDDLSHYFTSPFLKEMLGIFLGIKSRKGKIDFDELGISDVTDLLTSEDTKMEAVLIEFGNKTRGEDPVVHFYEDFLSAYNKQLKIQRGVFYTPQPVVSYIVRSVHELLQIEFGLTDGLADTTTWGEMVKKHPGLKLPPLTDEPGEKRTISPDEPFVQILDPATGTATFPVEVIDVIYRHLEAKWKSGPGIMPVIPSQHGRDARATFKTFAAYWNAYVPAALLPRLHAFELMMAPYAIAHMKVGLKLAETGYQFATDERARIYLTNALEPKVSQLPQLGFAALAREAEEVNEIKWYKRFTVVIGNPPYAGVSANHGEWITGLIDTYRFVDGQPLEEKKVWLKNDYVKFLRFSQLTVDTTGGGIIAMITDHSYLDSPTFRGLRNSLLKSFPDVRVLNLHGNSKRRENNPAGGVDENVFDITQGVAIALFTKTGTAGNSTSYADAWGSRQEKYRQLAGSSAKETKWARIDPSPAFYLFANLSASAFEEYGAGWFITDVFVLGSNGVQTSRDSLVLAPSSKELTERFEWIRNKSVSDAEIFKTFEVEDKSFWQLRSAREALNVDPDWIRRITRYAYRPFDNFWIYASPDFVHRLRREVMQHMEHSNLALCVGRAGLVVEGSWNLVFATNTVCDHNFFYRGSSLNCPLYRYDKDELVAKVGAARYNHSHNIGHRFSAELARGLKLDFDRQENLPVGLTPEDIFHYAYAVFHSPGYRSRYAEFLKIDFPRLPLTGNLELFRALARLGGELTALHLLEFDRRTDGSEIRPYHPITEWIGGRNPEVEKISWSKNTVWVDKAQTAGFRGVREPVWNLHIGGYQVCEKWLKDRKGRTLTKADVAHYHKIVIALSETIQLMQEIDAVIAKHGGWPIK